MSSRSFKRIFIVGCPRSGTTLLQSMLAAHPALNSFPETHFWDYTIPKQRRFRYPKIYTIREKKLIRNYLTEYGFPESAMDHMKLFYLKASSWSKALLQVLDNLTDDRFDGWIEKTPRHLYSVPFIKAADPDARFLHIVRSGRDVVASLYDVTHRYPEHWNGAKNIDECICKWKKFIRDARSYLDHPDHSFVCYDELTTQQEVLLPQICEFAGVEFEEEMLETFTDEAKKLVGQQEKWKSANIHGRDRTDKFSTIFSEDEQQYIIEQTKNVSLDPFRGQIKSPIRDKSVEQHSD